MLATFRPAQQLPVSHHQPSKARKGFFSFGKKAGSQAANTVAAVMGNSTLSNSATSIASLSSSRHGQLQSGGFLPNEGVRGVFECDAFAWASEADISSGELWDGDFNIRINDVIIARIGAKASFFKNDLCKVMKF